MVAAEGYNNFEFVESLYDLHFIEIMVVRLFHAFLKTHLIFYGQINALLFIFKGFEKLLFNIYRLALSWNGFTIFVLHSNDTLLIFFLLIISPAGGSNLK